MSASTLHALAGILNMHVSVTVYNTVLTSIGTYVWNTVNNEVTGRKARQAAQKYYLGIDSQSSYPFSLSHNYCTVTQSTCGG